MGAAGVVWLGVPGAVWVGVPGEAAGGAGFGCLVFDGAGLEGDFFSFSVFESPFGAGLALKSEAKRS